MELLTSVGRVEQEVVVGGQDTVDYSVYVVNRGQEQQKEQKSEPDKLHQGQEKQDNWVAGEEKGEIKKVISRAGKLGGLLGRLPPVRGGGSGRREGSEGKNFEEKVEEKEVDEEEGGSEGEEEENVDEVISEEYKKLVKSMVSLPLANEIPIKHVGNNLIIR